MQYTCDTLCQKLTFAKSKSIINVQVDKNS